MPNIYWMLCATEQGSVTFPADTTVRYYPLCGPLVNATATTETGVQQRVPSPLQARRLTVRVFGSVNRAGTFRFRKNAGNGVQSIAYSSGTQGIFQDTSNFDSLVAGDLIDISWASSTGGGTAGSGNTFSVELADTGNQQIGPLSQGFGTVTDGGGRALSTDSTNFFFIPSGGDGNPGAPSSTETDNRYVVRSVGFWKQLQFRVTANTRGSDTTVSSRKNGSPGNISVTVGSGATGSFSDLVNQDTLSPGDTFYWMIATGGGGGSITFKRLASWIRALGGWIIGDDGFVGTTNQAMSFGSLSQEGAESGTQQKMPNNAYTVKNMFHRVLTNTANNSMTITFRNNTLNTAIAVTVPSTATGNFEDSDSVSLAAGDLVNWRKTHSITAGLYQPSATGAEYVGVGNVLYKAFGNNAPQLVSQNYI